MTYKEFMKIMQTEELEESELVLYYLREAGKRQKYIKTLVKHNSPSEAIQIQEDKKIEYLWQALFTAIDEKKQGWRYVEDGEKVRPMLLQQLEDIRVSEHLRREAQ
ncbi:hypothetical protein FAE01_RS07040 [Enterococcus hirae]|uniref:hypothetical protein n=1 Tax=Enterococcus faecium TaxID=1352 RepID=UPI001A05D825|nr:hypothetical protein [Enterococcus faecium]EMF0220865.1 hypothetical protein [Enterococcus hirae]EMF0238488.1 hypothetical protein [Enterococcus hirae]MCL4608385.1 hypothetical protein [Enterococcus faecium]MCL4613591.1 hypothetical protein [Enterococcus faecium]